MSPAEPISAPTSPLHPPLPAFAYDASGNATSDATYTYAWDGESQLKSAGGVGYQYDGDGRRVAKTGTKLYWYGSGGDILAETNASGAITAEYVFFGGKRVAMIASGSTPIYYVEDLLGTSRVITSNTGTVCYDGDFYPYGGERAYTNSCPQPYKFEGKERDTETGNDDFGARYYSNRFGRWLSADWSNVPIAVPYANLTNPQTLNLYSMVGDDPESFADLDGHSRYPNEYSDSEFSGENVGQSTSQAQNQQGVAARQRYKTRNEAAKAAEKAALDATDKSGRKYEYGGWILKNKDGQYTFTIAITFKDPSHFYPDSETVPKGFEGVAEYHTHPHSDSAEGEGLSGGDEQRAYNQHRTVYEADTYSRNMYSFTPDVSEYKRNEWCCGVIGDFVAHIPQ